MKILNKLYCVLGVLIIVVGFISIFYNAKIDSIVGIVTSTLFILIGCTMLNYWSAMSYIWICRKCGTSVKLSARENFINLNVGINEKTFRCRECNCKTVFNGKYIY